MSELGLADHAERHLVGGCNLQAHRILTAVGDTLDGERDVLKVRSCRKFYRTLPRSLVMIKAGFGLDASLGLCKLSACICTAR